MSGDAPHLHRLNLIAHGIPASLHVQGVERTPSWDRRSALGRRDYAVIITLLRLGLRRPEVARPRLDDMDWRAAEVVVGGKGAGAAVFTVLHQVGKSTVLYG